MRAPILSLLLALSLHASAGEIDQPTALQMLQRADTVLIDVRTADEFAEGALPGAVRIETPDKAERIGTLARSEEHTSELQSLMRISYAVFCLKKKKTQIQ